LDKIEWRCQGQDHLEFFKIEIHFIAYFYYSKDFRNNETPFG